MKYNICVVVGLVLAVFAGLSLSGCRPHSGVVDTGEEEGGGGSETVELEPRLKSITFDSSAVTLTTEFRSSVFMYTADLNGSALSDLTIIAESTDQASIISYLADGQTIGNPAKGSIFVIKVDSSDHTKSSTYIVHLNDSGNLTPLEPALLSGITLTSGEITSFDTTAPASYDVMLPYGTKTVAVSAITANPSTHFVSYDPSNILNNPQNDDQIAINVVCSGRSVGTYVITFHIAAPLPSALTGISVSAGSVVSSGSEALVVDFNPNVTSYLIQVHRGAYTNMVVTGEVAIGDSVTYSPSNVISGTLDGKTITITVNEETDANRHIGYGPTVYTVTVQENDKIDAKLSDITFVPDNGTLYKWSGGSKTTNTGFDANCTTYTYKMNSPASITVVGQKTDSAVTVSYGGYTGYDATSPLLSPSAAKPLSIFATGPSGSHNATSYTVYFEWESAPLATLSSLSVPGAKFSNNSSTVLNPPAGNNNVTVPYGTTMFVVDAVPTNAGHIVTYSPASYSNPSANDTITVTVNGGPDFSTSTYIVKANIAAQQKPLLTSLSVTGISLTSRLSPNPSGVGSVLTYYRVLLDAGGEFDDVDFAWAVNADTSTVKYSTDGSDPSVVDSGKDGFSGASFTIGLGQTKPVLIRLTSSDGTTTNYTINVTRKSDSGADLSSLLVNNVSVLDSLAVTDGMEIKPTFAAINSPTGVISLLATAANNGTVSWGGSASGSGVGSSSTSVSALVPGTPKTVTITVTDMIGDDHLYTLVLFRTDAVYVAASGGSDSNTGQTADSPFATLKKALDTAKADGISKVMVSGTFTAANGGFPDSPNGIFLLDGYGTGTPITISGTNNSTDILQGSSPKRVVRISGGSKIKFENIAITGGSAAMEGAGVYVTDGSTLIVGSGALIWKNSSTGVGGGGVALAGGTTNDGGSKLQMSGGTISANSAPRGGGVYAGLGTVVAGSGPKIIFESGLIGGSTLYTDGNTQSQGNTATTWGGGIMFQAATNPSSEYPGTLTMSGGTISYNKLTSSDPNMGGGGIVLSGINDSISGGTISYNVSATNGGGIMKFSGTLTISGSTSVEYNTVTSAVMNQPTKGGGIFISENASFSLSGGSVNNNKAISTATGGIPYGGGIYLSKGASSTLSGTISGNEANWDSGQGHGGGIVTWRPLALSGLTLSGNKSGTGDSGGLMIRKDKVTALSGTIISGNQTKGNGAGVYLFLDSTDRGDFEMGGTAQVDADNDVYLSNGTAITAAASLISSPAATITPSSFSNRRILNFSADSKSSLFTLNTGASGYSSNWNIDTLGMLSYLEDPAITPNTFYVKPTGGTDWTAPQVSGNNNLGRSAATAYATLDAAVSRANAAGTGQTVVVLAPLYKNQGGNAALDSAFHLANYANGVTITGASLNSRTAAGNNSDYLRTVAMLDCKLTFTNITITGGRKASGAGVFIYGNNVSTITLGQGTHITGNTATANTAAGVPDSSITSTSPARGGGVYYYCGNASSVLNIDGAIIDYNEAIGSGTQGALAGGIYINGLGKVHIKGGKISNNSSINATSNISSYSGGIHVEKGILQMSGGEVSDNTTTGKGGGISVVGSDGNIIIEGSAKVTRNHADNYAGGILLDAMYDAEFKGGEVSYNSSDTYCGGIMASNSANKLEFSGTKVLYNTAVGEIGGVFIDHNIAATMSGGEIAYNQGSNAGGVLIKSTASIAFSGGSIHDNRARGTASTNGNGGGVNIQSTNANALVMTSPATIYNNTAINYGGGVYINSSGTFKMNSGSITGNTAASLKGGGVYKASGTFTKTGGTVSGNTGGDVLP